MAIFEKTIRNKNFDKLLRKLEREIPDSSWSANLEAGSDFKEGDARCSVRVFERYPDQLMIYAQRPDATACAEYDVLRFIASEPKNALRDSVTEIINRKCYHIDTRNTLITFQWRISI